VSADGSPPGAEALIGDPGAGTGLHETNAALRHRNAALYHPRVRIPDPLDATALRTVGASGTIAGLIAPHRRYARLLAGPARSEAALRRGGTR
jgi:hypothetical protein